MLSEPREALSAMIPRVSYVLFETLSKSVPRVNDQTSGIEEGLLSAYRFLFKSQR